MLPATPGWRLLSALLLLLASGVVGFASAQEDLTRITSARCNAPGEALNHEYCYPSLRRCLRAKYESGDLKCLQYSSAYRLVDGYAFLDKELPDLAVSSAKLLQIGPAHCWNVVPGNHKQCAVCRFQAAGEGFCHPEPLDLPGCQVLAHPHINEDCAQCAPGYWLNADRRCVSACPTADHLPCGDHCIPRRLVPEGFDCAAWPMSRHAAPTDEVFARPEYGHLLKCSRPGVCFQCHDSCDECAGPGAKDCTRCPAGRFLLAHSTKAFAAQGQPVHTGACVRGYGAHGDPEAEPQCPATTVDNGAGTCLACPRNCLHCDPTNPARCLSCLRGFFAHPDGSCGHTCPPQTTKDSLAGRCSPCLDPKCERCAHEDPSICLSCKTPNHVLHQNACRTTCPGATYNRFGICSPCDVDCALCTDKYTCYRCYPSFILGADECYSPCGSGTTWDFDPLPAQQQCQPCHENCAQCHLYTDNCTVCRDGMLLVLPREKKQRQYCVAHCPEGFYQVGKQCLPCLDPGCATCTNATNCTACKFAHALFGDSECFTTCPEGFYKYAKACLPCGGGCGTCYNGLGIGCMQCTASPNHIPRVKQLDPASSFDITPAARCTADALTQPGWGLFYQTQKDRFAVPCPDHCLHCFVKHPHHPEQRALQCVACAPGYTLSADGLMCEAD
ncbi:hypothetical protein H696_05070 [Fonticula alba]|uniref:EGF-like domain-containing protein n=1 Tax=Fonticula alba TaxID=691883 RepID=A0A058Z398_FONAL|nr:hypothetical protein H696_05070 [Fonticula alba]KCV68774.1 hypothetical protein H696_05070 [Fonticula alba]|eukprot:XP_009497206.1 hypothetical protein H696_05070 [Fonticula alba]